VDVVAESDFIAPDEPIAVVREEGLRIVVRKKV
jgi:membrane-bound ClpP family serine protease